MHRHRDEDDFGAAITLAETLLSSQEALAAKHATLASDLEALKAAVFGNSEEERLPGRVANATRVANEAKAVAEAANATAGTASTAAGEATSTAAAAKAAAAEAKTKADAASSDASSAKAKAIDAQKQAETNGKAISDLTGKGLDRAWAIVLTLAGWLVAAAMGVMAYNSSH